MLTMTSMRGCSRPHSDHCGTAQRFAFTCEAEAQAKVSSGATRCWAFPSLFWFFVVPPVGFRFSWLWLRASIAALAFARGCSVVVVFALSLTLMRSRSRVRSRRRAVVLDSQNQVTCRANVASGEYWKVLA